ncbi:MAG TPA: protein kinase [Blastocatellia bacterium]|nr:protein kinase [Blastocatellia bacterium]
MIGSVVGNYKIIDKIGEGGMGAVFKGVDLMLEREVAIKMLRPELARQPNVVERFRTEAVTLAKLNHSNVATLHSFFRQGEDFFMVMEFVRGRTLDDVIRAQGAMRCDQAIELFCMALEGIDHAHQMGIIHRDIKPANMMLTETGSIKVMDFGIARVLGSDRLTKAGHLIGTVEYMSPEQVRGEETDARSDIYSLGILLYEMLTGCVPFNSTSEYELMRRQIEDAPAPPRTHAPQIPLPVEQAIMRSLAKKREARYQSAAEFRAMLMRRNTGAVTRPLDDPAARTGGYAAPATQADRPMHLTPPPGDIVKATRLAGDQNFAQTATGGEVKATRLGQPDTAAAYSQSAPAYYAPPPVAADTAAQASFLSKLNWKHYAGAGAVLVAIITGTIALAVSGCRPVAVQPPTTAEPSGTQNPSVSPAPSEPAAVPAQNVQPLPVQPELTPGVSGSQPAVPGSTSSGGSTGRSRAASPKTTDTPSVSQPAPPVEASPQTQPAPKQENVAASKPEPDKKEAEKKPQAKKRSLFGKLKDAIVGGGDKKKDPNKP